MKGKDEKERNRARPTDEIKGEYVDEEDVKVKTETKENADKDEDNDESSRYSQRFFRMEAGQY